MKLENAQADYNQPGWHVSGAIDGDPATGWAIDKQEGHDHVAFFECHDPVGFVGGTVLTVTLDQQYPNGDHELGKFRLSATTARHPVRQENLPANIAAILKLPGAKRTPAQQTELAAYYRSLDPDYLAVVASRGPTRQRPGQCPPLRREDLVWACSTARHSCSIIESYCDLVRAYLFTVPAKKLVMLARLLAELSS